MNFLRKAILSLLLFSANELMAGTVDTIKVYSSSMKKEMKCVVIKPDIAATSSKLPVVYLLHGMGGNYKLWIDKVPGLQELSDRYGCLIVCPDGGRTTLYFNNPLDSMYRFESYFIKELIPYINTHYSVADEREFRAVAGLSMGGFGALFMASHYPNLFAAAGSMSGALMVGGISKSVLSRKPDVIADTTCCEIKWDVFRSYNSSDSTGKPTIALALECGYDDYLLAANRSARSKLLELKVAHDYTERPGRHTWDYWKNAIDYQLMFFRKRWDSYQ